MITKYFKENAKYLYLCKCGHHHITFVGDLGKDEDELGYERFIGCSSCKCEEYEKSNKKILNKKQWIIREDN